jgi:hypothetical protein
MILGILGVSCRICGRASARCAASVTLDPDADVDDRALCVDCYARLEDAGVNEQRS